MKKLAVSILIACMTLAGATTLVFAAPGSDAEEPKVVVVDTPEEYAENVEVAEEDSVYRKLSVYIEEGALTDSYGATSIVYNEILGEYLLEYETEKAGRAAYNALCKEHGNEAVLPCIPIEAMESTSDSYQKLTNYTSANSVSWGVDYMRLDELRDETKKYASAQTSSAQQYAQQGAQQDAQLGTQQTQEQQDSEQGSHKDKVIVAIADTGIRKDKALFKGHTISDLSKSFVTNVAGDYEFYDDSTPNSGVYGHGTHMAGIVADGTTEDVELMIIKCLKSDGRGDLSTALTSATYAADNGADVINMSLGVNLYGQTEANQIKFRDRINTCMKDAYDKGAIIVCAASNDHGSADKLMTYPANSPETIAVSAVKYEDGKIIFDDYSNYGSGIDYAAPGTGIYSAYVGDGAEYVSKQGTSMATPHVAAAFAMAKLNKPDATQEELTQSIDAYTVDLGTAGRDDYYGKGTIVFKYDAKDFTYDEDGEIVTGLSESGRRKARVNPLLTVPKTSTEDMTIIGIADGAFAGEDLAVKRISVPASVESVGDIGIDVEVTRRTTHVTPKIVVLDAKMTYNGKQRTPEILVKDGSRVMTADEYDVTYQSGRTKVGKYKITVTLKGLYDGKAETTFQIVPKGTSIRSLTRGKKYFRVKWYKRKTQTTGYQIKYSRYEGMAKASYRTISSTGTTSAKFSKKKSGRKYYVQIRTYKKVNGVKYYSAWSKKKCVRVK